MRKNTTFIVTATLLILILIGFYHYGRSLWAPLVSKISGKRTVAEVIEEIGPDARQKLTSYYRDKGIAYPGEKVTFLALKEEKLLEVWAYNSGKWHKVHTYPIQAASGASGPKLKEGDRQVPEGIYKIDGLNPNSTYHLSMKVNYPNAFDQEKALLDHRTDLGGDIFIHGKAVSIGCLAMGDEVIEELFVLAHDVQVPNIEVVICPNDMRKKEAPRLSGAPSWYPELYRDLQEKLSTLS